MYVDISDRLVNGSTIGETREKSLRRAFQDEKTVHFFAALKDAYFIPFEKKKKKKNEEKKKKKKEEEEEKEKKKKKKKNAMIVQALLTCRRRKGLKGEKILDDESAASNGTDEAKMDYSADDDAISKKVVDSHSRIALKQSPHASIVPLKDGCRRHQRRTRDGGKIRQELRVLFRQNDYAQSASLFRIQARRGAISSRVYPRVGHSWSIHGTPGAFIQPISHRFVLRYRRWTGLFEHGKREDTYSNPVSRRAQENESVTRTERNR